MKIAVWGSYGLPIIDNQDNGIDWYIFDHNESGLELFQQCCADFKIIGEKFITNEWPDPPIISQHRKDIQHWSHIADLVFILQNELHDWIYLNDNTYNLNNVYWIIPGSVNGKESFVIDYPYHIAEGMQPLYREKNLNPEILSNKFVSDKKYEFEALLGRPKKHRKFVVDKIKENQLENKTICKILPSPGHRPKISLYSNPDVIWEPDCVLENNQDCELHQNVKYHDVVTSFYKIIPFSVYAQSKYSVLSETLVSKDCIFTTEKLGKVFLGKRIFVVFASAGYLKLIKAMGFKTFDCIVDESYDLIHDDHTRFQAAWDQLIFLCNQNYDQVYNQCQEILNHNYNMSLTYDWNYYLKNKIQAKIKDTFYHMHNTNEKTVLDAVSHLESS